jgi:type I restriction enzyme S subunit
MIKSFDEVFEDATKLGVKIKTDEYHPIGKYQIIDQGQEAVAGYSDLEDGVFENVPAIVFGDHTRIVKYVDQPFFLGADGVKVLRSRFKDANYRYLYYALKSVKIPNTGYNRHFKWLKEAKIYYPNSEEQSKIVLILDGISSVIEHRQRQLQKLDELVKARFVELFGDPELNPRGLPVLPWNAVFLTTTGKLDSNAMVENGRYPFFTCAKESYKIDSYAFDCEALLLAGNNAAGIYDVKHYKGKFNAYQRTYVLRLMNEKWSYILFKRQLEDKLQYLQSQSKGTNTRYLTLGILNELRFVVPPVAEQEQFAVFVEQTDKSKVAVQKALDEAQLLFDSLMQKYFG